MAQPQEDGGFNWQRVWMVLLLWWWLFGRSTVPQTNPSSPQVVLSPHSNSFPVNTEMDLWVYISEENESFVPSNSTPIWFERNFIYGSWNESRSKSVEIQLTPTMQNNASIFSHSYLTKPGSRPNQGHLLSCVHQLNRYVKKNLAKAKKNLVSGEMDQAYLERKKWEEEHPEATSTTIQIDSLWKGNLTLNIVLDHTTYPNGGIPGPILKHFVLDKSGNYIPSFFGNDFWILSEDLMPINETVQSVTLHLSFEPISLWKWNFMVQMEESWENQRKMMVSREGEADSMKRILLDNDPYVLIATGIISLLHMVLDTLAFKNDIQFWRNQKSLEGLSVRSLYISVTTQVIVLLYLLDNDTSWMILFNVVLGLLIDAWKVTKAVNISRGSWNGIPIPIFTDKNSYASRTKDIDLDAMKYLYYALYPLVFCYAIYSVVYETHRNWYSFLISTAAGCVYTFGFIAMTPQLFINYKLKSVAHLPMRVFVYKAISTFIDDIFVFLIRMPTLHRLRVFRDDIVFFIYLYQRYIYPVDTNRVEVGAEFEDVPLEDIQKARELMEKQQQEKENQQKQEKVKAD